MQTPQTAVIQWWKASRPKSRMRSVRRCDCANRRTRGIGLRALLVLNAATVAGCISRRCARIPTCHPPNSVAVTARATAAATLCLIEVDGNPEPRKACSIPLRSMVIAPTPLP